MSVKMHERLGRDYRIDAAAADGDVSARHKASSFVRRCSTR